MQKAGGREALRGGEEGEGKQETGREGGREGARRRKAGGGEREQGERKAGGKLKRERSSREGWRGGGGRRTRARSKREEGESEPGPAAGAANQQRPGEANSCQQEDGRNQHRTVEYPTGTPDGPHPTTQRQHPPCLAGDAFTKKKQLAPASFLTFGKVNAGPPQTDIFFGEGVAPPGLFLTLGKVNCHRHLEGRRLRLTFFLGEGGVTNFWGGGGFKSDGVDNRTHVHLKTAIQ